MAPGDRRRLLCRRLLDGGTARQPPGGGRMILLLDLTLAGSRIAVWIGVALIVAAAAALLWLAAGSRPSSGTDTEAPRIFEATAVRHHRSPARRSTRSVVRHADVDGPTIVIPELRDQTEQIPTLGGRRG